jgi:hypothetical protein
MNRRIAVAWILAAIIIVLSIACAAPGPTDSEDGYQPQATPPAAGANEETNPVDGVFKVPDQIKPGKYVSVVPDDSFGCYWARLTGTSGDIHSIIANDVANAGNQVRVTIKTTDKYFETNGCGPWKPEGS